jgi:hypothetical protein
MKSYKANSQGQLMLWLRLKEYTFCIQVRSIIAWANLLSFSGFSAKRKVIDMCGVHIAKQYSR